MSCCDNNDNKEGKSNRKSGKPSPHMKFTTRVYMTKADMSDVPFPRFMSEKEAMEYSSSYVGVSIALPGAEEVNYADYNGKERKGWWFNNYRDTGRMLGVPMACRVCKKSGDRSTKNQSGGVLCGYLFNTKNGRYYWAWSKKSYNYFYPNQPTHTHTSNHHLRPLRHFRNKPAAFRPADPRPA